MRRRPGDERGFTAVIVALLLTAILIVVAIVIDIGQARQDRVDAKRLSDAAVTAGIQDIEVGPWQAVCTAYGYVRANAPFSSFASETWTDAASTPTTYVAPAGSCPTAPPSGQCISTNPATWSHFHGVALNGDITVDIESAYTTPDPAFAEDATITGDDWDPCGQIAVIMSRHRGPIFGRVAGGSGLTIIKRSVARLTSGPGQTAALVVLERTDCRAIDATTNGGEIIVHSVGDTPGTINVDSAGTTNCSGSQKVIAGSALPSTGGPNIIADPTATSPARSGRISSYALRTNPSVANTTACAWSPTPPATCTIMPIPTAEFAPLGRTFLDNRYLSPVRSHIATAKALIATMPGSYTLLSATAATASGSINVTGGAGNRTCTVNGSVTVSATSVYVDCNQLKVPSGSTLRFTGNGATIVTQGTITVSGSSGTSGPGMFLADQPAALDVVGTTQGANPVALAISGTFALNYGSTSTPFTTPPACPAPTAGNPTTTVVVQDGALSVNGGSSSALELCQTSVLMASGYQSAGSPPSAWPTSVGSAPYDNSFKGQVTVGGQGTVDWTAPNAVPNAAASAADWANLEDLTLWTETGNNSVASSGSTIGGQGGVQLAGVFALPNANFTISGTGSQTISADAQFWTRKLNLSGQAVLQMAPNPNDSIPSMDFALVR